MSRNLIKKKTNIYLYNKNFNELNIYETDNTTE